MFTLIANRKFYLPEGLTGSTACLETAATVRADILDPQERNGDRHHLGCRGRDSGDVHFSVPRCNSTPATACASFRPSGLDATANDFSINFAARKGSIGD